MDGQDRLAEIIDRMHEECINDHERRFIESVMEKSYWVLSKHEKAAVNRIYSWVNSQEED